MLFLAPTGLVLVTLQMLGIPFNKWLKFVMPISGLSICYLIDTSSRSSIYVCTLGNQIKATQSKRGFFYHLILFDKLIKL